MRLAKDGLGIALPLGRLIGDTQLTKMEGNYTKVRSNSFMTM